MYSLGRKVVIASVGGLLLVLGCYALVAYQLEHWTAANNRVVLDYQRALHDGQLHVAMTRAAGEVASYVLSGNPAYRAEAEEALEQAQRSSDALRTLLDADRSHPEGELHRAFARRQSDLLRSTSTRLRLAIEAASARRSAENVRSLLEQVYSDEAELDALWSELAAHHAADHHEGERSLRDGGRAARLIAIGATAVVTLALAALALYVRRRLIGPLTKLARLTEAVGSGDLALRSEVTHRDEIGQLQLSFNRAVQQIGQQRDEMAQLVDSLKASRDAAMAASQTKSHFLANVSHEIRTPLHSVIVSLDLMHDTAADPAQRRLAEVARTTARGLLGMLNDLLDASRIEAGKLALDLVRFEPRELVAQSVELHARQAAAKGLTLSWRIADDVPTRVCGDPQRVGQVLGNLLGNAIRFTDRGSIDVAVSLQTPAPTEPPLGCLHLRVSDTGVGVPADEAQRIFEPFYQARGPSRLRSNGLGLGLGIARELTRMMGGEIGFDSEVGKGSSFWFTVPLRPDADCADPATARPSTSHALPAGKAVLLVEDHAATREVMSRMLRRRGLEVATAEDGRAAVALAAAGPFDLILMDCQLPEMDGYQATRAIRALPDERAAVPIVGLTAYGLVEQKQRYLDAGFDDLVVKPYTLDEIERALHRWLSVASDRTRAASPASSDREISAGSERPQGAASPPPPSEGT